MDAAPEEIRIQQQTVAVKEAELKKLRTPDAFDLNVAQVDLAAKQTALDQLRAGPTEQDLTALNAQIQSLRYAIDGARQAVPGPRPT